MTRLAVIDADSHIMETEDTWAHLPPAFAARRPVVVRAPQEAQGSPMDAFWLVDGQIRPRLLGAGATFTGTPIDSTFGRAKPYSFASQTISDAAARLRDMDTAGIDIQVLFPTAFVTGICDDPALEAALMQSYNTWMSGIAHQAPDRLKWMAVMPMRAVDTALAEVRRARALGATGVAMYGTAGARMFHEPQFDPFWAAVEQENLPVGVHVGWSHPGLNESGTSYFSAVMSFTMPIMMAFFSFTGGGLLERFPGLRVGFFEAGADWIPYWAERLDHYWIVSGLACPGHPRSTRPPSEYLRDGRVYATCEGDERLLPQVLDLLGEDQIMISGDMPHMEAREDALGEIKERADISEDAKVKVMSTNAARFFDIAVALG